MQELPLYRGFAAATMTLNPQHLKHPYCLRREALQGTSAVLFIVLLRQGKLQVVGSTQPHPFNPLHVTTGALAPETQCNPGQSQRGPSIICCWWCPWDAEVAVRWDQGHV
jgi:hypothetical protein